MDSETRYRQLFADAQDGVLILDAETAAITDVNPFLASLLGYSHAELLGKPLWEIGLCKDVEAAKSRFRELVEKQYIRYEDLPLRNKDGSAISVEFVSHVYRVKDENVIQCNVHDIRRREHAEHPEQRLLQPYDMRAVGKLAGGLAHDFNNLLGVILGYCEILEEQTGLPAPTRKMISEIHRAGASARNLTRRLLAFSRRQNRNADKGNGLALSTVFGTVKQSGDAIAPSSKSGEGTAFHEPPLARQPRPAISGGTETILLVDDAAPLRQLTRRLLEEDGYKVIESGDPAEALRMAGEYPGPLPLMITDLFMPGFSGSVLARKLAPFHPETKVLYASGYDDDSVVHLGVRGLNYAFLEKPFTRDQLLGKVRELLDSPLLAPPRSAFSRAASPLRCG
jgi:PAS domain S-box-containing protein